MLTSKDSAVLNALFDAEISLNRPVPMAGHEFVAASTPATQQWQQQQILEAVHLLNEIAPSPDAVRCSIGIFDKIIDNDPTCASAFVNRAQAMQLLPLSTECLSQTFQDLSKAIELSEPKHKLDEVTSGNARVLASAHTHRGSLLLRASVTPSILELLRNASPYYHDIPPAELEQLASKDYTIAGRYGSQFAQSLAVKTNPYAKLCGNIVREALQKEIREYSTLAR